MTTQDYSVFDNMIEGVQVINNNWQYVYVNEALIKQSRTTKEDLLGHTMMEKYPGIENTALFKKIGKCMKERKASNMLNEFKFPDNTIGWFDLRMEPVKDGVLIMSFDVSKNKLMELELKELYGQLEFKVNERTKELVSALEREKKLNETKSTFVSMAAHEFRTPLSIILMNTSLAEKYSDELKNKREICLERIKKSVNNLVDLLNDFLSLDQLEHGKMEANKENFDLKIFLDNITKELKTINKKGQNINYSHIGNADVLADKKILRCIVLNLLSNAIKYSDKNIDLKTEVINHEIIIKIKDRGIGIPEEQQKDLFNKFFRASNASSIQGTGLGLNIVKHYVELLNGSINFDSQENKGTTFTIKFPNELLEEVA